MNEIRSERVITLKDLWEIFVRRILVISLVAVIAVFGSFTFDRMNFTPQYESTASMYIQRNDAEVSSSTVDAYNELILALKMVNDCTYIIKSRTVVNQVIEDLDLRYTYGQLSGRISTGNPENTRILEVTVTGDSGAEAKEIVDQLCLVAQTEIDRVMGFSSIKLYEQGDVPSVPYNKTGMLTFLLIGVAAAVATFVVFLIMYLLDDRICSEEDIEQILGLSVLGEIPDLNDSRNKKKGDAVGKGVKKPRTSGTAGRRERRS